MPETWLILREPIFNKQETGKTRSWHNFTDGKANVKLQKIFKEAAFFKNIFIES